MHRALALLLLWPLTAEADASAVHLAYQGTLAGARMITAEGRLDQTEAGYTLRLGIATFGAASVLMRGRSDVVSQGIWQHDGSAPTHVDSEGYWNGRPRRLVVDYVAGVPAIRVMQPADPQQRRALRHDDIAGTVDGLGLVVGLMRKVALTGRCDLHTRVFDGRGVTEFTMTTANSGAPAPLRCDFTTRKVAGLKPGDNPARVDRGYALFAAPAPNLPRLPVKVVFQTRWTGDAVVSLTQAAALAE